MLDLIIELLVNMLGYKIYDALPLWVILLFMGVVGVLLLFAAGYAGTMLSNH
ncbi:MAG: hypothetical protein K1X53_09820 [Candidatus Sumerlaeaceae bacterium]|nr:hypothetical protein [Candidatus Sumerlaeaceae bacterium]